jgi:hypothetical protein
MLSGAPYYLKYRCRDSVGWNPIIQQPTHQCSGQDNLKTSCPNLIWKFSYNWHGPTNLPFPLQMRKTKVTFKSFESRVDIHSLHATSSSPVLGVMFANSVTQVKMNLVTQ